MKPNCIAITDWCFSNSKENKRKQIKMNTELKTKEKTTQICYSLMLFSLRLVSLCCPARLDKGSVTDYRG